MNDQQCDIHDVTKAASDLMSLGCSASGTYLPDSVMQLTFSSAIANYLNGVIRDVNDRVTSAWEGMQKLKSEYDELADKIMLYAKNGIGIAGGVTQVKTGAQSIVSTRGFGFVYGGPMIMHGFNNIYEGATNIYNGNNEAVGFIRHGYRKFYKGTYQGDMAYYSTDLLLSATGLARRVEKEGTFKLFRHMPTDSENAYKQTGKISLMLEALVDALSLNSLLNVEHETNTTQK